MLILLRVLIGSAGSCCAGTIRLGLKLFEITFGLGAFLPTPRWRTIRTWTDSEGGCHSVFRGGAKQRDHNELMHRLWAGSFR